MYVSRLIISMSFMAILCSNCSRKDVDFYCYECIPIEKALALTQNLDKNNVLTVLHACFQSSLLCSICKELHGKIKSTKMHKVQSLVPSIVPCYNCEETDSNIICLDCIDLVLLEKLSQENNLEGINCLYPIISFSCLFDW